MNRWVYYSPLWLGFLAVLAANELVRAAVPTFPPAKQWFFTICIAIGTAVHAQLVLIGAQGAFAQVLPVPVGKSIRGGGAQICGWLIILWVLLGGVGSMLYRIEAYTAVWSVAITNLAVLAGAVIIYVWNIPAAQPDFRDDRRARP